MIKIVKKTENNVPAYQVVDEAYGDIPELRGALAPTVLEAVNEWLRPNNDESGVAKFLAEVPIVGEEAAPEPRVGEIPQGNVINMIMSRNQSPSSYHSLVGWCMSVLGYESTTDENLPDDIPEITSRVQKITDPLLLLKLIEVAKEGIRGCRNDKYNDAVAKAIQNACMSRLRDFADSLPPSLWHKVHRFDLWMENAETEMVSLPSPNGWVAISGFRESQHGGWRVRMRVCEQEYLSPQYVTGMGMKARHDDYAKGSHSGVVCEAFHLFNADGTLWGYEIYLISPKKTVGCEVTKDGSFSLFRNGVTSPPRKGLPIEIRQGDMLLRRVEVQQEDEIASEPIGHPVEMVHVTLSVPYTVVKLTYASREHRHVGYFWHPITRSHVDSTPYPDNATFPCIPRERVSDYKQEYENVLILKEDAVLRHPDHPSISLKAGYWRILPVEGETDYRPRQRGGD